ncbi:MAG: amidohydrolase [Chloroflexota bacterium]|nr:amidohydrolase [Chloroflexota bacterium]
MTSILIRNAHVITLDSQDLVLPSADIAISDGAILSVGAAPVNFQPGEIIDATDHVALPGFFNAHTHAAMTLERGWAEDLPLDRWFNERVWVAESALEEEDVYWGATLAACEMIRGGTVAFADHYFWMDQVARVVEESGLKALLAWCVFGLGAEQEIGGTTLERTIGFIKQFNGAAGGRIHTILGPHSPYICSPEFLARVARESERLGIGVHLHLAESKEQFDASMSKHGKSPAAVVADLGLLDRPSVAAHCLYLTEADMEILAKKGATVAHCPKTYMKLSMGVAPVLDLLRKGVNVAVGTDGPASNNNLDMLESTRLAVLVQKLHSGDPQALPSLAALRLATQAGARALGFPNSGELAPGRSADLILMDLRRPHLCPRHDLAANVVHAAQSADVSHVIVNGRLLLRDHQILTLDEERIRHEAEKRAFRMVNQDLHAVRHYQA